MQVGMAEARVTWRQSLRASASHRRVTATKCGSLSPQERDSRLEWVWKQALTLSPAGLTPPQAELIAQ